MQSSVAAKASGARSYGRWYVLVLISLMYLITYLDRVNISTAAPVIAKEFGFDKVTMGIIFSAFVWSYAAFQVPGSRMLAIRTLASALAMDASKSLARRRLWPNRA